MTDGDQVTAETSWRRHVEADLKSAGVMSVYYSECTELEIPVVPDPVPYPEHVFLDFRGFPRSRVDMLAGLLTGVARDRGWCYEPV